MEGAIVALALFGCLIGGFISGFAGFGFALVVSGIWFAGLPAEIVPPLVVLSAAISQVASLLRLSDHITFSKALPLTVAGLFGIPIGTLLVAVGDPNSIKLAVGVLLIAYTLWQFLTRQVSLSIPFAGPLGERVIGFFGGILGGLAGLSGVLPIIWYQLAGLSPVEQRTRYQPFNLVILIISAMSMALFGQVTSQVLTLAAIGAPAVVIGSFTGVYLFKRISARGFRRAVLVLLMLSGVLIMAQTL